MFLMTERPKRVELVRFRFVTKLFLEFPANLLLCNNLASRRRCLEDLRGGVELGARTSPHEEDVCVQDLIFLYDDI